MRQWPSIIVWRGISNLHASNHTLFLKKSFRHLHSREWRLHTWKWQFWQAYLVFGSSWNCHETHWWLFKLHQHSFVLWTSHTHYRLCSTHLHRSYLVLVLFFVISNRIVSWIAKKSFRVTSSRRVCGLFHASHYRFRRTQRVIRAAKIITNTLKVANDEPEGAAS